MTYRGTVCGGVVVFKDSVTPPEGTDVTVVMIGSAKENGTTKAGASIWEQLMALGRAAESAPTSLPSDLAENHDHYLHGLPKRK
jgi:hypothetical protein